MNRAVWIILFLVTPAMAAVTPDDFDFRLYIEAPSQAGLLQIRLPEDAYRATRRPNLADLRIFNSAGEAVPMARMPRVTKKQEQQIELPLLSLPKVTASSRGKLVVSQNSSGSNVRVEIDGQPKRPTEKVIPGYLLDVKDFDVPINELILHWSEKIAFEAAVQIRASNDLNSWRTVVRRVPILAVGGKGSRLVQNRVKLPSIRARYLRITWVGEAPDVSLSRATLVHSEKPKEIEHQWLTLEGKARGESILYTSPGLFPVDRVRVIPVDDSDVIPVILYSRHSVSKRWRWRTRTLGYRLQQNGGYTEGNPDIIAKTHDPLWRADLDKRTRSSSLPRLQIGWVPEEVVFVARGAGPFTLAVGASSVSPVWLSPRQVIPGFGTDKAAAVIPARILPGGTTIEAVSRSSGPWSSGSNWVLWGALMLGVVVLGLMARGLWRDIRFEASDSNEEQD
jgi:hypothetical protein